MRLLGVPPVDFWRALHALRDRISFGDAVDGWTHDSVGELVTVLEGLFGEGAERALTEGGLFLPLERGTELTEDLLFSARRLAAAHVVRDEELAAMLRHTGSVRRAIGIYLEEHVDLEALIRGCSQSFSVLHDLPPIGAATAARYLHSMFDRHILDRRGIVAGLSERLKIAAAALGYEDPEDRARAGRGQEAGWSLGASSRRTWALRVMGLDGGPWSPADLRASYRRLMMRFHPDADPAGLERCKDVNVAYALLISESAAAD